MANIIRVGGGAGGGSKKKLAIEKLTEGTIVRIKEKGVEQDYYLAQHDYQPSLNGSGRVLFVRKEIHSNRAWHSSNVNAYATSDINAWLNSEMKSAFDADVREAMGETTFPYTVGNGNGSVLNLSRSIFLLSLTELGYSETYAKVEGETVPIANNLKIAYLGSTATNQWTRTPSTGSTAYPWAINTTGTAFVENCVNTYGVRPCFTLPNTATVLGEANLDGSYTLSLGDDDPTKEYFKLTVVDGTEKPTNPAENTIWVNTDVDMGMCYLAPNAPDSPEVGDVWVNTTNKYNSNGTNASTNLIRVNDNPYLEINVFNISQWDGSAWVTKDGSAIYANGGWTNMALWIFNEGVINADYPIVYSSGGSDSVAIGAGASPAFTSGSFYFQTSVKFGKFIVKQPIDFSKFSKLTASASSSTGAGQTVRFGAEISNNPTYGGSPTYTTSAHTIPTTRTTYELDISTISGQCYPSIQITRNGTATVTIWFFTWCLTA